MKRKDCEKVFCFFQYFRSWCLLFLVVHHLFLVYIPHCLISEINDGTYRGEFSLPRSPLKAILEVTVENHILTLINMIEHNCSPVGRKAEGIIDRIIESQSLDIDVISGAILSSKTIKMAIQKALE